MAMPAAVEGHKDGHVHQHADAARDAQRARPERRGEQDLEPPDVSSDAQPPTSVAAASPARISAELHEQQLQEPADRGEVHVREDLGEQPR